MGTRQYKEGLRVHDVPEVGALYNTITDTEEYWGSEWVFLIVGSFEEEDGSLKFVGVKANESQSDYVVVFDTFGIAWDYSWKWTLRDKPRHLSSKRRIRDGEV